MRLSLVANIVLLLVLMGRLNAQVAKDNFIIRGNIVSAVTGQPLERTDVSIGTVEHLDKTLRELLTGPDGSFSLAGLAPGKYWLAAQKNGFRKQLYEQHGIFTSAIAVGPGLISDHISFRLHPDAAISGKITDSENEAVPNATVLLFRRDASRGFVLTFQTAQTMSDDRGYYHFGHLESGRYFVVVSGQPWYGSIATSLRESSEYDPVAADSADLDMAYPTTYYPGVTNPASGSSIMLHEGADFIADVILTPTPALRLRINHANGAPGQPREVTLKQYVFGTMIDPPTTRHESRGDTVEILGIPSGKYILEVESSVSTDKVHGRVIELTADSDIDANSAATLPMVSGAVQRDGGLTIDPQAFVQLWNSRTAEALNTVLTANGEFSFDDEFLVPGTYSIFVVNGESLLVGAISAIGAQAIGQSIQITGSTPVRLTIRAALGLAVINGIARHNGKPIAGAMIILVPENAKSNVPIFRRDQSDSDGSFTLRDILPGKYKILGIENHWDLEWADPAVLNAHSDKAVDVEIRPSMKYEITVETQ
ncbi:MAG TPA: carboxypeptidase-like regulatory domain-containing protein [Terriglobales bacterium]|nr:carboxypeptidase-like regulatory domain-containing protein [Terriglobales bacterium]